MIYNRDTGAYYFDNISAAEVALFLLKQAYKSLLYLTETMEFLVRLAVPSKLSSQPTWLKV